MKKPRLVLIGLVLLAVVAALTLAVQSGLITPPMDWIEGAVAGWKAFKP